MITATSLSIIRECCINASQAFHWLIFLLFLLGSILYTLTLLFFDFGSGEILLIVLAIFLIFGPEKIPELARNLGKFVNDIKRASEDIKTEINKEADRKDREKRLEEYKSKVEEDLAQPPENEANISDHKTSDT